MKQNVLVVRENALCWDVLRAQAVKVIWKRIGRWLDCSVQEHSWGEIQDIKGFFNLLKKGIIRSNGQKQKLDKFK